MAAVVAWLEMSELGGTDSVIVNVTEAFEIDQDAAGWNNAVVAR